ncbi:Pentatricopeptide repeat-containing protein [Platanthera zijinensis]|uniref:Pentatricopeptide repeat-containing protein n=1 Tax=Platanthera zijinensis TaxID=2320716 RepID=A0AAP0AUQ3_9ASPA
MRVFNWSYKFIQKMPCTGSYARAASWIVVEHGISSSYSWHHRLVIIYQKTQFSSSIPQAALPPKSSLCEGSMKKLEDVLEEDCVDRAWEAFYRYTCLHGFPKQAVLKKMVILMTRSLSLRWLLRAYKLLLAVARKTPHLLDYESLTRLALILARNQMPVPASTLIRIALGKFKFPSLDILNTMFLHFVKSDIGSYLASNILIEICEQSFYQKQDTRVSKKSKLLNPNVTMFNLVLDSCSKFGSSQQALLIIKLMSQIGVAADANSIVTFARIYDTVGQRDELIRLKMIVDNVSFMPSHYCQFYDSLLSLHFKYNDLDAAVKLVLDLYNQSNFTKCGDNLNALKKGKRKPCSLQIGSDNLTVGYKLLVEPELLGGDFIFDSPVQSGLVLFSDGKLLPSTKSLAKLISRLIKETRVGEVSNLLIGIEKKIGIKEGKFSTSVLIACIQLDLLEIAHDVLDDLDLAGISVEISLYKSLFQAYCKRSLFEESKVLLKQMRKKGLFGSLSDEEAMHSCLSGNCIIKPLDKNGDISGDKTCLAGHLYREIREGDMVCQLVYEFNSTILFFCNASMMEDAIRTVKRMQQKNIQPTIQTFSYLLNGYSSLKMYRQIAIFWGEIKRRLEDGVSPIDQDLLDCFLMNFLRGGYFKSAVEIANYMTRYNIFADKWKYKNEFLKFHKNLYRNLKTAHAKTDAQRMRFENVQAFRKWVNIARL